jgi:hypothetical protein
MYVILKEFFMKRYMMLLLILVVSVNCFGMQGAGNQKLSDWYNVGTTYFPPIFLSALIGAGTGALNKYLEKELKINPKTDEGVAAMLGLWIIEHLVRNKIILGFQEDFQVCNIPYKRNMMHLMAWIASWVAYTKSYTS